MPLKQTLTKALKQALPPKVAMALALRTGQRRKIIDWEAITQCHLSLYPGAEKRTPQNFIPSLFEVYYGKKPANHLVPATRSGYADGFVPYYRGVTKLVLHNFFGRNYGIRDPILFRMVVCDGLRPAWVSSVVLPSDGVHFQNDFLCEENQAQLPEHGTLMVQAFHPRIKTLVSQLRFFAFYSDPQKGSVCGIHSMPIPESGLGAPFRPAHRSFARAQGKVYYHTCLNAHTPLAAIPTADENFSRWEADGLTGPAGFITMDNSDGPPWAVWHDGPDSHRLAAAPSPRKLGTVKTGFLVPDFSRHAPVVLVSAAQVGFLPEKITIRAMDPQGNLLAEKNVAPGLDPYFVDLREVFAGASLQGSVSFIFDFGRDRGEFEKYPVGMLHIYYRSPQGFSDQLHSENTIGFSSDPVPKMKAYRCRKFAPLLADPSYTFTYAIINVGGENNNSDTEIKLRLSTDAGSEFVLMHPILPNGITPIDGDFLLKTIASAIRHAAVVQIEHERTNYAASWYCVNRKTGHLGGDHFSGG